MLFRSGMKLVVPVDVRNRAEVDWLVEPHLLDVAMVGEQAVGSHLSFGQGNSSLLNTGLPVLVRYGQWRRH